MLSISEVVCTSTNAILSSFLVVIVYFHGLLFFDLIARWQELSLVFDFFYFLVICLKVVHCHVRRGLTSILTTIDILSLFVSKFYLHHHTRWMLRGQLRCYWSLVVNLSYSNTDEGVARFEYFSWRLMGMSSSKWICNAAGAWFFFFFFYLLPTAFCCLPFSISYKIFLVTEKGGTGAVIFYV